MPSQQGPHQLGSGSALTTLSGSLNEHAASSASAQSPHKHNTPDDPLAAAPGVNTADDKDQSSAAATTPEALEALATCSKQEPVRKLRHKHPISAVVYTVAAHEAAAGANVVAFKPQQLQRIPTESLPASKTAEAAPAPPTEASAASVCLKLLSDSGHSQLSC